MPIRAAALLAFLATTLAGQSTCPSVNFLSARRVNLKPSATSHIDLVRQSDGSYTGFEVADAPPYRVIETTPQFERQFAACTPQSLPASRAVPPAANPAGAGSQLQASAAFGANYFVAHISADQSTLYFDLFDAQHRLLSEKPFTSAVTLPGFPKASNESFQSLALADLNGDGKLDLIAVLSTSLAADVAYGGVWTFPGNGDGTFGAGNRQALTSRPMYVAAESVSVADLNGDGKPDIVLSAPGLSSVAAFLGNGDGSFQTKALTLTIPGSCLNPLSTALADLNGDGKADLVVYPCENAQGWLGIAAGNGDGSFQAPVFYPVLYPAKSNGAAAMVAVGDVNGDGIPDIVSAGGTVLFGDGKGGVASRADFAPNFVGVSFGDFLSTGAGPVLFGTSVMLGDFDGDGKTDILFGMGNATYLSGSAASPTLTVVFGAGNNQFTAAPVSGVPLPESSFTYSGPLPPIISALAVADFNGDGVPDAASVNVAQTSDNGGNVLLSVLRGKSNGQFAAGTTQTFAHSGSFLLRAAVAGDFNHDGKPDLAVLLSDYPINGELQIYPGKGDGTFGTPYIAAVPIPNPLSIAQADLNGDGIPDLVVTSQGFTGIYLSKGDGTVAAPILIAAVAGNPGIVIGDFNGDGKADLAFAGEGGATVSVLLGNGDGTFSKPISSGLPAPALGFAGQITAADFNGDGRLDLAVSIQFAQPIGGASGVAILLGKGDGSFAASAAIQPGMEGLAVADFNGDKIPDLIGFVAPLLGPQLPNGSLSVRIGNGDGTFQPDYILLGAAALFAIVDLNRDGLPDAAVYYSGGILSLLNESQPAAALTVLSAATYSAGPLAPGSVAAAFGEGILPAGKSATGALPLSTQLAGVAVTVKDSLGVSRPAGLYFASSNQINFVIPTGTATGLAAITVNGAQSGKPVTAQVQITALAPALFTVGAGIAAAYAVAVAPSGTQTVVPVFTSPYGAVAATPIDLSQPGAVYLSLFGTGFEALIPGIVSATVQGVSVPITSLGPQGTYPGLDQINLLLPQSLAGAGMVNVAVSIVGVASNTVLVNIR